MSQNMAFYAKKYPNFPSFKEKPCFGANSCFKIDPHLNNALYFIEPERARPQPDRASF